MAQRPPATRCRQCSRCTISACVAAGIASLAGVAVNTGADSAVALLAQRVSGGSSVTLGGTVAAEFSQVHTLTPFPAPGLPSLESAAARVAVAPSLADASAPGDFPQRATSQDLAAAVIRDSCRPGHKWPTAVSGICRCCGCCGGAILGDAFARRAPKSTSAAMACTAAWPSNREPRSPAVAWPGNCQGRCSGTLRMTLHQAHHGGRAPPGHRPHTGPWPHRAPGP